MLNKKGEAGMEDAAESPFVLTRGMLFLLGITLVAGMFFIAQAFDEESLARDAKGFTMRNLMSAFSLLDTAIVVDPSSTPFTIEVQPQAVIVSTPESKKEYALSTQKNRVTAPSTIPPGDVRVFSSEAGVIRVSSADYDVNALAIPCESRAHTPLRSITLDAGHGGDDTGVTSGAVLESVLVREVATRLISFDASLFSSRTAPIKTNEFMPVFMRKVRDGSTLLSLHFNKGDSDENALKFFVNANDGTRAQSSDLACQILNALTKSAQGKGRSYTGAVIVPLAMTTLDGDDPRMVLDTAGPGVFIELGSIDVQELTADTAGLAQAVYEGIGEYGHV